MDVTIVKGDDWQGLYVDGKLKTEDHTLLVEDVLNNLGIRFTRLNADIDWLHERGALPEDLCYVVQELPSN